MASRHALALAAGETSDLTELAHMLIGACEEVIAEEKQPFKDVAVRLICFQIAFAGNGDLTLYPYYADAYEYCEMIVSRDQVGIPFPEDKIPNEPVFQTS